jgi:hypothetical protein
MSRIAVALPMLLAVAACAGSASASGLGPVTAASVTTWTASSTVPTSSCSSNATQDATVDSGHKNTANGTLPTLTIASPGAKAQWGLVQFTPCAPANAAIVSASMQLSVTLAPLGARTYGAYAVNSAWSEATVTWNTAPTVSTTASNTQPSGATGATMTWSLTADVQAIVNGGANNGWAIEDNGAGTATGTLSSREGAVKPVLSLVYYP